MAEKLYIHGGSKVRTKPFEYLAPLGEEEMRAAEEVIRSKQLSGFYKNNLGGERVREFEADFAKYLGVKYAISVNSGTSALHVALAAAGIGEGDEVIVPPFTFTATAAAVRMVGAYPVFVDVDPDTFCLDPSLVEAAITEKTKAIMPVHIYGKVADLARLQEIATRRNLLLIEDACQAPGALHDGVKVVAIGVMGIFSFVETKNIVIGEGGMITTNDDGIAERCRLVRNHGEAWVTGTPREYWSQILGYNFRLDEVAAAIGIEQMKKLDQFNEVRKENAAYLEFGLGTIPGLKTLHYKEGEVCHLFAVLIDESVFGVSRIDCIELLASEGIPASAGYPHPLYKNPVFQECKERDYASVHCKVAEDICSRLICLQRMHVPFTVEDMKDVVRAFEKIYENRGLVR